MKVILFGATGMVGQACCTNACSTPGVDGVLAVGRGPTGQSNPKLREIVHGDFADFGMTTDRHAYRT